MTERVIELEITVPVPPEDVFAAWVTPGDLNAFFGRDCFIEPRLGGAYEIYFLLENESGSRGSEGCRILEFDPPRRLAFSWNFPPHMPAIRDEHTRVELTFTPIEIGGTRVAFRQSAWQDGPAWDEGFAYFSQAWRQVLESLREYLSGAAEPQAEL